MRPPFRPLWDGIATTVSPELGRRREAARFGSTGQNSHASLRVREVEIDNGSAPMSDAFKKWLRKLTRAGTRAAMALGLAAGFVVPAALAETLDGDGRDRARMVQGIEAHAQSLPQLLGEGGIAPRILKVMGAVERHRFVPASRRDLAYADRPVSIGFGQTISQPFIVALMTHLLKPAADHVVLEIGTGSAYQAAVLAPLVAKVCTIEIVAPLGERAEALIAERGIENVQVKIADGYHGWPDCGPFDGIVVTAAADHVPPPLVAQLKPGGRMVIPVGGSFAVQYLTLIEKSADGEVRARQLLPVRFVPFTRAGR